MRGGKRTSKPIKRKSIKNKNNSVDTSGEILSVDSSIEKCLSAESRRLYKQLKPKLKSNSDILKALINDNAVRHNSLLVREMDSDRNLKEQAKKELKELIEYGTYKSKKINSVFQEKKILELTARLEGKFFRLSPQITLLA